MHKTMQAQQMSLTHHMRNEKAQEGYQVVLQQITY